DHPRERKQFVYEHILVMEQYLGRYMERDEVVHHINEIRDDNRIENLKLMTRAQHTSLHMKKDYKAICNDCGINITVKLAKQKGMFRCSKCYYRRYWKTYKRPYPEKCKEYQRRYYRKIKAGSF